MSRLLELSISQQGLIWLKALDLGNELPLGFLRLRSVLHLSLSRSRLLWNVSFDLGLHGVLGSIHY